MANSPAAIARNAEIRPSPDSTVAAAKAMRPMLNLLEPQANAARGIPADTIRAFKEAGFFRLLQPKHYGGFDADYEIVCQVIEQLTMGCSSSAWVYGVVSLHSFFLASWPPEVHSDVWGQNPDLLISSSLAPRPISKVEGGYRLDGAFTTGIHRPSCSAARCSTACPIRRCGE